MQLDSSNAKHKLVITALFLVLFAIPFVSQWHSLDKLDGRSVMAGGAVIANSAQADPLPVVPLTNNSGKATTAAGSSFTGVLAR